VFCPIEKLELTVNTCPASGCTYKGVGGSCNFSLLTREDVSVRDIAEVRQKKPYKIQTMAATAKHSVVLGATLLTYADYIKDSFPNLGKSSQTVNKVDSNNHLGRVLFLVFGLSVDQQKYFWDEKRLAEWTKRKGLSITLSDIRAVLLAASI
jgi:hypothetical protein